MTRVVHLTSLHSPRDPRIFYKECTSLAEAGYEVLLVAPGAGNDTDNGVQFVDFPSPSGRLSRVLNSSRLMARLAETLDGDVYHIHDPELLPAAKQLARRGHKVVYDSHEYLSKALAGRPYLPRRVAPLVGRIAGRYEDHVVDRLTAVVAATPTIAEQFDPSKTVVVANYPIATEWADAAAADVESYAGRRPVAVYVGGITNERGAEEMVRAAALLDTQGASITFAGPVNNAEEPSGTNVEYLGVLPRVGVGSLLAKARVGLCVLHPIPNYVESLPTKVFEYLSAGLPVVVAEETPTIAGLVEELGCGLSVPFDSPTALAAAIDELFNDPERAFKMGQLGRNAVLDEYSWGPQKDALIGLYDRIAPITG